MVQTFFKRSCTIDRLQRGPLAGHIDLLAARLATDGYSRVHSRIQIRLVGQFNRWLNQNCLTAEPPPSGTPGRISGPVAVRIQPPSSNCLNPKATLDELCLQSQLFGKSWHQTDSCGCFFRKRRIS